ncbi:MAG: DUF1846 domain-containing protein [Oscillospiraceae bacterium]|jgi:uncharacterized protein (UPF0371 family)|nr:DUF1846 domain-containing protein [Oscillospiraceae bacterium]
MKKTGFDASKYLVLQSGKIAERMKQFGGKLYLEFGGKLFDDTHASRVLPGFEPNSKVHMLQTLKSEIEVVMVINAGDIEQSKRRGDLGITYDQEALRLIDAFRAAGLYVGSVVVTHYEEQEAAVQFIARLDRRGVRTYRHFLIDNYPHNISLILSDEGFGKNEYIETERRLVVVTAPGGGSGKMAVCLSQLYHENKRGYEVGYAKYETFPVWNLPLQHPVNLAYEAATADLGDSVMLDAYHQVAYNETAVSYNRDMETFPVLLDMFKHILGSSPYKSPTDMGVNMISPCITDDGAVSEAARQEVVRRYYEALCERRQGLGEQEAVDRLELLMSKVGVTTDDRPVVKQALARSEQTGGEPAVAIELPDGRIVTGKTTDLLGAASAALLNALKALGNIPKKVALISPDIIEPIQHLKINHMGNNNPRLHTNEILIALTICAGSSPEAEKAMEQLGKLKDCEAHSTVLLSRVDQHTLQRLGINLTCEPKYQTKKLFHK